MLMLTTWSLTCYIYPTSNVYVPTYNKTVHLLCQDEQIQKRFAKAQSKVEVIMKKTFKAGTLLLIHYFSFDYYVGLLNTYKTVYFDPNENNIVTKIQLINDYSIYYIVFKNISGETISQIPVTPLQLRSFLLHLYYD